MSYSPDTTYYKHKRSQVQNHSTHHLMTQDSLPYWVPCLGRLCALWEAEGSGQEHTQGQ